MTKSILILAFLKKVSVTLHLSLEKQTQMKLKRLIHKEKSQKVEFSSKVVYLLFVGLQLPLGLVVDGILLSWQFCKTLSRLYILLSFKLRDSA